MCALESVYGDAHKICGAVRVPPDLFELNYWILQKSPHNTLGKAISTENVGSINPSCRSYKRRTQFPTDKFYTHHWPTLITWLSYAHSLLHKSTRI